MPRANNDRLGFTLIELSIVIVVIALIVAVTVGANNLISSSKRNSIITDLRNYQNAMLAFKLEYNAVAGDFDEAIDYWGVAAGNGENITCYTDQTVGTATCNGNGDNKVEASGHGSRKEQFLLWQHLSAAEIIKGEYTGASFTNHTSHAVIGLNVPESSAYGKEAGWYSYYLGSSNSNCCRFDGNYGHVIFIGAKNHSTYPNWNGFLTPAQAKQVDEKIDDGKPGRGLIYGQVAQNYGSPSSDKCSDASSSSDLDSNYVLSNTGKNCLIMLKNAY